MEEGGGEAEINFTGVVVEHGPELVDVPFVAADTVYALCVETVEVDGLYAGVDYVWDAVVAVDEVLKADAEDRVERRVFWKTLDAVVTAWLLLDDMGGRAGREDCRLGYDGSETTGLRLLGKRREGIGKLGRELGDLGRSRRVDWWKLGRG